MALWSGPGIVAGPAEKFCLRQRPKLRTVRQRKGPVMHSRHRCTHHFGKGSTFGFARLFLKSRVWASKYIMVSRFKTHLKPGKKQASH